jgi:hypothetical protein
MNKKICLLLVTAITAASIVGCVNINKTSYLDSILINFNTPADRNYVGINQADIAGFENASGSNPTMVTVNYTNADNALNANCLISLADGNDAQTGINPPTESAVSSINFNSFLGGLSCAFATTPGTYSADLQITFTANGINYIANKTLTATK